MGSHMVVVKGLTGRGTNKERVEILSLLYQNMPTAFGREVRRPLCSPVATTRGCLLLLGHSVVDSLIVLLPSLIEFLDRSHRAGCPRLCINAQTFVRAFRFLPV
jgi:hypothetical protein